MGAIKTGWDFFQDQILGMHFSTYGDMRVGDTVTLVYSVTTDNNGDETRTVLDYIED